MSRDKLRAEIAEYLTKEANMFRSDKQAYLERIVDREFFERNTPHAINRIDLMQIVSNAGSHIAKMTMPVHVSNKQMDSYEVRHIAMIEAIIGYLNRNGLLNREVKFDYTSQEYAYEPLED